MSVIVINWSRIGASGPYQHIALLLNGLPEPVYISVYMPKQGTRFTSAVLKEDLMKGKIAEWVCLPSYEDGNKAGLSESLMAAYWQEVYNLKKISYIKVNYAALQDQHMRDALGTTPLKDPSTLNIISSYLDETGLFARTQNIRAPTKKPRHQNYAHDTDGRFAALTALSNEFKMFQPLSPLDCVGFAYKILQKGGIEHFTGKIKHCKPTVFIDVMARAVPRIQAQILRFGAEPITTPFVLPKLTATEEQKKEQGRIGDRVLAKALRF